ncbi:MAG: hypothetical protein U5M23_02995 [Marinagarivorans sp.]|nr:hypothetical protein [Marinagarivorans sp.]
MMSVMMPASVPALQSCSDTLDSTSGALTFRAPERILIGFKSFQIKNTDHADRRRECAINHANEPAYGDCPPSASFPAGRFDSGSNRRDWRTQFVRRIGNEVRLDLNDAGKVR